MESVPAAQVELTETIAEIVRANGWDSVRVVTVMLDALASSQVTAVVAGVPVAATLPMGVRRRIRGIRDALVDDVRGAWLSVQFEISSDGSSEFAFDYERRAYLNGPAEGDWFDPARQDPRMPPLPTDGAYRDDLERYPRHPDNVPSWYPVRP